MGLFSQSGDWGYEDNYSYKLGNRSEPMTKIQKFLKLISENPDLPIIPMVDHEVVCEDCGKIADENYNPLSTKYPEGVQV